jgi:hypothetical protein
MGRNIMSIQAAARAAFGVLAFGIALQPVGAQQQPAAVSVPRSVLERYVGEYALTPWSLAFLRLKGDTLIREMNGQQEVYIALSETRFKVGNTPFTAEFAVDQAGAVTQIVKAPNGPEMRAARLVAGPVPRSVLERYVGEYEFMPRLSFVIRLRGETLSGQQTTGGPETALIPVSETGFTVGGGATQLEVEFVTDKEGKMTKVVRQGSYEMRAVRKAKP